MVTTTLRNAPFRKGPPERPTASTYWRRRFVALVIGLSVLALVTWALSGAMGGSAPAANNAPTKSVHGTLSSPSAHPSAHTQPTAGSRSAGTRHQSGPA